MRPGRRMWTKRKCWPGWMATEQESEEQSAYIHGRTSNFPETSSSYHLASSYITPWWLNLAYLSQSSFYRFPYSKWDIVILWILLKSKGGHAGPTEAAWLTQTWPHGDKPPAILSPKRITEEKGYASEKEVFISPKYWVPDLIWSTTRKDWQKPGG